MSSENSHDTSKKKLAIFDQFYNNPKYSSPTQREIFDTVGRHIDLARHDVVVCANELGRAAASLMRIRAGEIDQPDVMVIGGTLDGEYTYLRSPEVIRTEKKVVRRKMFGSSEQVVYNETLLLPFVDDSGNVTFISRDDVKRPDDLVVRYDRHLEDHDSGNAVSAFVLTHLAKEFLGDKHIKIIGHSNSPMGNHIPLDVFLFKGSTDPRTLQQEIDL